ncbi:urease accessory protein [Bradyrhizobium sp. Rc2d]|nr:urease accessory protein [Bradyrhizobium sp. Rc2d]
MPMPATRMGTTITHITITMIITVMITTIMAMPRMTMVTIITITTTSIATTPTIITTATSMLMTTNEPVSRADLTGREAAALYRLMTWLSPAFPVGGFSYSSGIEWAVEAGDITDTATLADWLDAMLGDGSGFCDATFLVHAYRAAEAGETTTLNDIAELAAAFVPSRERQLETTSQGRAFIDIARAAWDADGLDAMVAACRTPLVYPVAVGVVAAMHGVPLASTLHAFLHALVSNWISAASRLIPLGQTDSQRVLVRLEAAVGAVANRALNATLDDLGSTTFRADLASLRHETQYTRLFRS